MHEWDFAATLTEMDFLLLGLWNTLKVFGLALLFGIPLGLGLALGRMSLVRDHLVTGRLLRPLNALRPGDYAYYTVTTAAGAERPRVQAFLRWLEEEVEGDALETDAL